MATTTGEGDDAARNYNRIVDLGNWYDVVAMLYLKKQVACELMDAAGVRNSIRRFRDDVTEGMKRERKTLDEIILHGSL